MTGEGQTVVISGLDDGVLRHERELPQPGGRAPAPGDLVLLQSFINTHFDLVDDWGADRLATPRQLQAWLARRRLLGPGDPRPRSAQMERVIAVREGLRELARQNGDPSYTPDRRLLAALNEAAGRSGFGTAVEAERLVLTPSGRDAVDRAIGLFLAIAARALIDGRWSRLKVCPGEHCGWVFYDHSRNNSGRWCSMAVCGGRTKARSHYRRRRMRGSPG